MVLMEPTSVGLDCPKCSEILQLESEGNTHCPKCDWTGDVYIFHPKNQIINRAEDALPEDAICVHHPNKKAVVVCEGTGDYICSLCSIEIDDKIYGAAYLNSVGKGKIEKAFNRYLDRPDREILFLTLSFLFIPFAFPIAFPYAIYRFFKMVKVRKEPGLHLRLIGMRTMVVSGLILSLSSILYIGMVVAIFDL